MSERHSVALALRRADITHHTFSEIFIDNIGKESVSSWFIGLKKMTKLNMEKFSRQTSIVGLRAESVLFNQVKTHSNQLLQSV